MLWCVLFVCVFVVQANTDTTPKLEPTTVTTTTTVDTTIDINSTNTNPSTIPSQSQTLQPTHPPVRVIEELKGLNHNVSSGKIMIIGDDTIQIPNFHFDGTAPTAFFIVGKGNTITENGTKIHLNGSTSPLPPYNGESVKLTLPNGLSVKDLDWLAVWCFQYRLNMGYVYLNKEMSPNPPQTLNLNDRVTSGPIILINKKTLYIPNFRYDGGSKNVHFWVGNGEPSSDGRMVPDEKGSLEELHVYQGQNLDISLPDGVTTDNIEYFGVWSKDEGRSLGHVPIKIVSGVPEAPLLKPFSFPINTTTLILPKCCPLDSVLTLEGCEERPSVPLFRPPFNVYKHNLTHFLNESLDLKKLIFTPYVFSPKCETGKYPLDEDNDQFAILQNASLLVKGAALAGILSTEEFCLDYIESQNETVMKILVCVPEYKIQTAMFFTYVIFTIISTLCLAVTVFLYLFWLKVEDIHRRCFAGYAFTMAVTFLSLTIVQTASVEDAGCEVLGFVFQIFMIASFTLLGILCFDIFIIVKYIDEKKFYTLRKRGYLGIAVGVPAFFMFISLVRNLVPDVPNSFFKPQYMKNNCYFDAESQRTIIFYIPICLSMVGSAVCLIWTKLITIRYDRDKRNDYFWIEKGTVYKFMWRKHLIIFLTSLMWLLETIVHLFFANSNILIGIDIVEASQGILVVLLFVVNKETRTQIVKTIKARRRKKKPFYAVGEEDFIHLEEFNKS
ncbi:uncharacterized protein LOC135139188 isoform X1 [Zophobas morio]|uniref:uncharacterized protein LOC135139188 isoform X1 n=1 Tax=Zophobas morio TaxID=2755281 RepID=UPI003083936B